MTTLERKVHQNTIESRLIIEGLLLAKKQRNNKSSVTKNIQDKNKEEIKKIDEMLEILGYKGELQ